MKAELTTEEKKCWEETLFAGVAAQKLIEGSIAVGGTAAAMYAGHRLSFDTDHLLMNLRETFDEVLDKLSDAPEWKTARLKRPVLILGSIGDIEVGFRQSRRTVPIETVAVSTPYGDLVVPTLDELIGMKAYLGYDRNTVRDFLDFAALTECTTEEEVLGSLLKLDERYGDLQSHSARLEVARALSHPKPVDFSEIDLSHYKALAAEWHEWKRTEETCKRYALLLGQKILGI
ncbi:MAG: hypothetical protein MSG64_20120 [Pyrinomonadaceae bacterium MAG19_C2-C3]|nr:hypothetical protein [Pyrinomonadaceae bacterium MAG19_C2-C3]